MFLNQPSSGKNAKKLLFYHEISVDVSCLFFYNFYEEEINGSGFAEPHIAVHCMTICIMWCYALHGTVHCMELCTAWNCALRGTVRCMELCIAWNFALRGTVCCMELCTAWNCALRGTLHCVELCVALSNK